MALNKDFLMGFVSGTVVGAVGYKLYEENGGQLKSLIQPAGSTFGGNLPAPENESSEPSLEDLVSQKERLEDLIAEQKATESN